MNKNSFLITLSESARTDFGRMPFNLESPLQRVFSAIWALESEVNSGGFSSYFARRGAASVAQRQRTIMEFALSDLLTELLSKGIWPADSKVAMAQSLRSLIPAVRVRLFAAEEDNIFLNPPPFRTIADELASASVAVAEGFWARHGALEQIVPAKAVILGDFGLGSDAPIILNYAVDPVDPPVYWLRWRDGRGTDWVQGAPTSLRSRPSSG